MKTRVRAEMIRRILDTFYHDDPQSAVIDILTDLRHYCDRQTLDFGTIDWRAYLHYLEEKRDEENRVWLLKAAGRDGS